MGAGFAASHARPHVQSSLAYSSLSAHPGVQAAQRRKDPREVVECVMRIHWRLCFGRVAVMGHPPSKFSEVVHMLQPGAPHVGLLHSNR
jgi:hypothetical protein